MHQVSSLSWLTLHSFTFAQHDQNPSEYKAKEKNVQCQEIHYLLKLFKKKIL